MKLHLNFTLRRALLAAMALLTVQVTRAELIYTNNLDSDIQDVSKDDAYITGEGTVTIDDWYNRVWVDGIYTLSIGTYQGEGIVTLAPGEYTTSLFSSIYIGGAGYDSAAEGSNSGTLNIGSGSVLAPTYALHVGNSQQAVTGTLHVNGGEVRNVPEFNVGMYSGTGIVIVDNGGKISAVGTGLLNPTTFRMASGSQNATGEMMLKNGSSLVVGSAGATAPVYSSIGTDGKASLILESDSSARFYGQTIIGEKAGAEGKVSLSDSTLDADFLVVGMNGISAGQKAGVGSVSLTGTSALATTNWLYVGHESEISASNQSAVTTPGLVLWGNDSGLTLAGASTLTADMLAGTGKMIFAINSETVSGTMATVGMAVAINPNPSVPEDAIPMDVQYSVVIDAGNPDALVGKSVDFISIADTLQGVDNADISITGCQEADGAHEACISWAGGSIVYGTTENGLEKQLLFTTHEGSFITTSGEGDYAGGATTGITFTALAQQNSAGETYIESYNQAAAGTSVLSGTTTGDDGTTTTIQSVISGSANLTPADSVTTAAVAGLATSKEKSDVIIGKNVTMEGDVQAKMLSIDKVNNAGAVIERIGSTGVCLVYNGEVSLTGGNDSVLGFKFGTEGSVEKTITVVEPAGATETREITEEIELVDVIRLNAGAEVVMTDMEVNATHALIIDGTADKQTSLTLAGNVDMLIGGSVDTHLFEEVESEDGTIISVESGHHVTTHSEISNAEIALKDEAGLAFKKVSDDKGHEIGSVTFENCIITQEEGTSLGGLDAHADTIELEDSTISGSGSVYNFHMVGGKFKVGSSPTTKEVAGGILEGSDLEFAIITNSVQWDDYDGSGSSLSATGHADNAVADGDFGAISQLLITGPVTLDGATFRIAYEEGSVLQGGTDGQGNAVPDRYRFSEGDKSSLPLFDEGDTIQFITFENGASLTGTFNVDAESLPDLVDPDNMEWDFSSLLSNGSIKVIFSDMLEEPVRIANSLLSAGDTVLDFGRLTETQASLRKAGTTRTWGSALAVFDSVDRENGRTGYDYNAWDGAVGVDYAFSGRTVAGAAFGCSWGENKATLGTDYYDGGKIDQDGTMLGLYGTHKFRTKGLLNDVKLSGFAAYGWFENSSRRASMRGNHSAVAEWDSSAWVLSASLSRDITTDKGLVITPWVGIEYTKTGMDDFSETSPGLRADYSAAEDYSNLALKFGVGVSRSIGRFMPYAGISYICDVARDTPAVTAAGHHVVTGRASMPGRHAVRFNVGTGVKLSDSWDAYAGYSAELRDKATEHNVNVGVGYTF